MSAIEINPVFLQIGLPALLLGLVVGGLIAWLFADNRRRQLENKIKDQGELQRERDAAFEVATGRLSTAFSDLANKSLKSNSENFLRLAEQNLATQHERAKRELGDREQAIENLVKPIRDSLQQSQQQISDLEKARSEAYGSIKTQLESMQSSQQSLAQETQNLVNGLQHS